MSGVHNILYVTLVLCVGVIVYVVLMMIFAAVSGTWVAVKPYIKALFGRKQ